MSVLKKIFIVNSYYQAVNTVRICNNNKIYPIIFVKYNFINKFGIDWLKEMKILLDLEFSKNKYSICVDCNKNYGLLILLIQQKIDYLKFKANGKTLNSLKQIAKKNKVLLNPNFSIVDLSKIKNISLRIEKKYKNFDIKFYVNCGGDYGLCINLINYNIDYIKIRSNLKVYNKIKQIAKKNKVLLNPNFNIVDLSKIKNLEKKLNRLNF